MTDPTRHYFTARPVSPEEERAATERAIQAAAESAQATAWITAHSTPDTDPAQLRERLERAHTEAASLSGQIGDLKRQLAALRAVSRGYCPDCGRGDAAPTVEDWEQQRARADNAEAEVKRLRHHRAVAAIHFRAIGHHLNDHGIRLPDNVAHLCQLLDDELTLTLEALTEQHPALDSTEPAPGPADQAAWRAEDHAGHGSPCEQQPDGSCAEPDTCRPVEVDGQTIRIRGAGQFTEQEQQFAEEIVRAAKRRYAAEHAEPDAKQLRAHAFNAVLFALNARGEWLPLSSRRAVADAVLDVVLPGARITATLARMSDAAVQRVIDLYERWVKAGPPPLGTSVSRWWDARLIELRDAVLPPEDQPEGQS